MTTPDQSTRASPGFSENEIRPAAMMDEEWIACVTDIGRLLTRRREFVRANCPACDSPDSKRKFSKNGFDYEQCGRCSTFYVNPRPTPEVLQWFYKDSLTYAYWNKHIFPASEQARCKKIVVPRVDRVLALCQKYRIRTGSLLEVGAGFGTFCSEVASRTRFRRVVAIEPTPDLAKTCSERHIETINLPIEQVILKDDERFDVVANFEVIEHLFSPRDFLQHVFRVLNPGGLFAVTCPNGEGFDIQVLGTLSATVDHEHLNYFSPKSLCLLLERCGFEVLESFTPGKLDAELVRNKALSGEFDLSGQPFLKRVLIDEWEQHGAALQEFISNQGLSSSMWVVARKPGQ